MRQARHWPKHANLNKVAKVSDYIEHFKLDTTCWILKLRPIFLNSFCWGTNNISGLSFFLMTNFFLYRYLIDSNRCGICRFNIFEMECRQHLRNTANTILVFRNTQQVKFLHFYCSFTTTSTMLILHKFAAWQPWYAT